MAIPPELAAALERILAEGRPVSIEEVNALMQAEVQRYNSRPQRELGGLSPEALYHLLHGDWRTTGSLRIAEDVPGDLVRDVPFVADARSLLEYVAEHEPVKLTAAGYLPRAAMLALVPRLRIPQHPGLPNAPIGKAPKELDYPWLELIRATTSYAGLISERGRLRLLKKGRTMLAESKSGALYALLLRTLFRQVDLFALFAVDGYDALQQTLAYTLYRLPLVARDWTPVEDIVAACWLETAREEPELEVHVLGDLFVAAFQQRVLDPLEQFGLVEHRVGDGPSAWLDEGDYRITELYERVVRVDVGTASPERAVPDGKSGLKIVRGRGR